MFFFLSVVVLAVACWLLPVGRSGDNIFSVLEEMMKPDAAVNHWAGLLAQYRVGLGQ